MTPEPLYAKGWHPSHPAAKALFGAAHPLEAAPAFPAHEALRPFRPRPTWNQGRTSSCTGHATTTLIFVVLLIALLSTMPEPTEDQVDELLGSPDGVYRDTLAHEQPGDGPLEDVGVSIADVMLTIAREGVRRFRAANRAPDGRFSDCTPESVARRPTLADDLESAHELVLGPEQLDPRAPDFLDHVAASIGVFHVGVSAGIHASPGFEYWKAGDPPLDDTSGFTDEDGHNVAILDYRTEADGSLSFWALSSWGEDFGEDGGAWVTGRWLRASCMEAWRMRVQLEDAGAKKLGGKAPVHVGHGLGDGCT